LEKEARWIWQKQHKNPTSTDKGWICRVFYMRIEDLYKKSGKAGQAKKEEEETQTGRCQRANCLREKARSAGTSFRESDTVAETGFSERA
jgi:hypothetical protein